MNKIAILIPCYNESLTIQKVIKEDGFLTTDKLPFLDKRFGGKVSSACKRRTFNLVCA